MPIKYKELAAALRQDLGQDVANIDDLSLVQAWLEDNPKYKSDVVFDDKPVTKPQRTGNLLEDLKSAEPLSRTSVAPQRGRSGFETPMPTPFTGGFVGGELAAPQRPSQDIEFLPTSYSNTLEGQEILKFTKGKKDVPSIRDYFTSIGREGGVGSESDLARTAALGNAIESNLKFAEETYNEKYPDAPLSWSEFMSKSSDPAFQKDREILGQELNSLFGNMKYYEVMGDQQSYDQVRQQAEGIIGQYESMFGQFDEVNQIASPLLQEVDQYGKELNQLTQAAEKKSQDLAETNWFGKAGLSLSRFGAGLGYVAADLFSALGATGIGDKMKSGMMDSVLATKDPRMAAFKAPYNAKEGGFTGGMGNALGFIFEQGLNMIPAIAAFSAPYGRLAQTAIATVGTSAATYDEYANEIDQAAINAGIKVDPQTRMALAGSAAVKTGLIENIIPINKFIKLGMAKSFADNAVKALASGKSLEVVLRGGIQGMKAFAAAEGVEISEEILDQLTQEAINTSVRSQIAGIEEGSEQFAGGPIEASDYKDIVVNTAIAVAPLGGVGLVANGVRFKNDLYHHVGRNGDVDAVLDLFEENKDKFKAESYKKNTDRLKQVASVYESIPQEFSDENARKVADNMLEIDRLDGQLNARTSSSQKETIEKKITKLQDEINTIYQEEEGRTAPTTPQMAPAETSVPTELQVSESDQNVLNLISERVEPILNPLAQRMTNAEEIEMSEIESVAEQMIDEQSRILESENLSEEDKQSLSQLIESQIDNLLDYEFATITTTEQTGQARQVKGVVRFAKPGLPQKVSTDRFFGTPVTNPQTGERGFLVLTKVPITQSRTGLKYQFISEAEMKRQKNGEYKAQQGLLKLGDDVSPSTPFTNMEYVSSNFSEDGNLTSVVLRDAQSGNEIQVDDQELALDIAIAESQRQIGTVPEGALLSTIQRVVPVKRLVKIFPNIAETGTTPAAVGVEPQTEQDVRQETNAPQEGRGQGEDVTPVPQEEGRQEGQVTPPAVAQEGETPPATGKKTRKTEQQKADEGKAILDKLKETLRSLKAKPGGGANIDLTFGIVPISKAVWNTAIDTAILAIDAGQSIAQAVKAASDYISSKIDGDWGKAKFEQYLGAKFADSGLTKEEASIPQEGDISVKDVKVVKGEDFKFDAEWEVRLGDRVIGRLWYDRSIQFWMNTETMFGPGTATNPFKGILGSTKEEAIEKLVDDYNKSEKAKDTKVVAQEVEERDFSNDKVLNRFLNRLSSLGGLEIPFFGDGFVYNGKALVEFDRFDKADRNEVALRSIMAIDDTGKGVGSEVMSDITSAADELGTKLTLYASPFGTKAMSPSKLVSFYKKFGFTIDLNDAFGGDFSSEKSLLEYLDENPGEGVDMVRVPQANPRASERGVALNKLEETLRSLKVKVDGNVAREATFMIPALIYNSAIDVAILTVKAADVVTKDVIIKAINAAVKYVNANFKGDWDNGGLVGKLSVDLTKPMESYEDYKRVKEKGKEPSLGQKVGVRFNLNIQDYGRKGVLSVHDKTYNGEVIDIVKSSTVSDVKFSASKSGASKIKEGLSNKFPIASVDGSFVSSDVDKSLTENGQRIFFNPKIADFFYDKDGREALSASKATLDGSKVFANGLEYGERVAPIEQQQAQPKTKVETGEDVARMASEMQSDQGFSDFTLRRIASEDYTRETASIDELRKNDPSLEEYIAAGEMRETAGTTASVPPIVSSNGEVIDGYNRILQAVENGEKSIEVLKGRPKAQPEAQVEATARALEGLASDKFRLESGEETPTAINVDYGDISWPQSGLSSFNEGSDGKTYMTDKNGDIYQVSKTKLSANKTFFVTIKNTNGEEVGSFEFKRNSDGSFSAEDAYTSKKGVGIATIAYDIASKDGEVIKPSKKLKKDGVRFWAKSISNAYHKAKADGSNPELVNAVDELLGQTPEAKPAKTIAEQRKEFRETAKKYFDGLKKMGVAFDPERNSKEDIAFLKALAKYIKLELDNGMVTFKGFLEKTSNLIEGFNEAAVVSAAKQVWAKEVVKAYPKVYSGLQKAKKALLNKELQEARATLQGNLTKLLSDQKIFKQISSLTTERKLDKSSSDILIGIRNEIEALGGVKKLSDEQLLSYNEIAAQTYKDGRINQGQIIESLAAQKAADEKNAKSAITNQNERSVVEFKDANEAREFLSQNKGNNSNQVSINNGEIIVDSVEEFDILSSMFDKRTTFGGTTTAPNPNNVKRGKRNFYRTTVGGGLIYLLDKLKGKTPSQETIEFFNRLQDQVKAGTRQKKRLKAALNSQRKVAIEKIFRGQARYIAFMLSRPKVNGERLVIKDNNGKEIKRINVAGILYYYQLMKDPHFLKKDGNGERKIGLSESSMKDIVDFINLPENEKVRELINVDQSLIKQAAQNAAQVMEANNISSELFTPRPLDLSKYENDAFIGEILSKIYNNAVPSEIEYFPSNVESDENSQVPKVDALLDQEMDTKAVSAMSRFMIERVSGGKVRIKSYDAQLGEYFDSMSNTASKLPILKKFQAVFNKENSNLISSYYGKNTTDELRENIGRYITSRQQDSGLAKYISSGPFSKWLASGLGVQMVFAFTSAFSQLSSTPGPILSYGVKNYLDGLLMLTSGEVNPRRAIIDLTEGSLFRERFGSRIEVADIVKAIPSDETGFASYVNEINKKLISIGAIPSSAFDALSIILSLPIYAREYSNALKTMTRKEAADYAEDVLMDKAENFLQSKSDEMMSSFESKHRTTLYAFATVVPQLQRQAIMAFKRIQRGEGDLAQNINVLVWSGIGSSVAFRLLRPYFESLFEGDDDDEELKKLRDDKRLKRTTIDLAVDATKSLGTWGAISAGVLKTAYQLAEAEGDASVVRRALDITPEALEFIPAVSIKVSSINNAMKSYYDDEDLRGTTQAIQALTNIPTEKARGLAVQMSDAFLIDQFTLGERLTRLAGFVSENKAREKMYQKSISTNPEMRELLSPSEIQRFESKQKSEYKSATSAIAKQYSEATTQQDRDAAISKLFSLQASTTKYSEKESGELIQQIQDDFDSKVVENLLPEGFLEIKRMPSTKKVNFVANEFNKIENSEEALSYVESLYMYGVISENERGEVFDILLQTKTKQ